MKQAFVNILQNPNTNLKYHSTGWTIIQRKLINPTAPILTEDDDWDKYDELIILNNINYKPGVYNLFGGVSEDLLKRAEKLCNFMGQVYADDFSPNSFFQKRNIPLTFHGDVKPIPKLKTQGLVVGDSHSMSVWPGYPYNIHRNDGKTLYGFLKEPYKADIYYFGNIDIRFHLGERELKETTELAMRYIDMASKHNAYVVQLLPIESEERRLPKTGYYKGQPFYGSRNKRLERMTTFNNVLELHYDKVMKWPKLWYENNRYFEDEIMEPNKSVHIKPLHYKYINELVDEAIH